jgi:hypothetical protein
VVSLVLWSRNARGAVLLIGFGIALGCNGQTDHTSDNQPPGGPVQSGGEPNGQAGQGDDATNGGASANGGTAASGGASTAGRGHAGSSGDGGSGGVSATGGQTSIGGTSGTAGASGTTGTSGSAGTSGTGGVVGSGIPACGSAGCGFLCFGNGGTLAPGDIFYQDCNQCQCQLNGIVSCESKDCNKDCQYLADEYTAAYGEAQYCLMGPTPDPCTRIQSASLDCSCPSPVSTLTEFQGYSIKWAQRWSAAGCKDPNQICPPCPTIGKPYCNEEQGICMYK